jgi:hypothetical protein
MMSAEVLSVTESVPNRTNCRKTCPPVRVTNLGDERKTKHDRHRRNLSSSFTAWCLSLSPAGRVVLPGAPAAADPAADTIVPPADERRVPVFANHSASDNTKRLRWMVPNHRGDE